MIRRNRESLRRWLTVLGFVLHPGQQRVLDAFADGKRFLVIICGRRWGKTLLAFILAGYALLEKDARILVVSKTYRLAGRVWAMLIPHILRVFGRKARVYRGSLTIRTVWGAELVLGSADHPDSLLGEGYDLVIFDEAATCASAVWHQYIRPALMDRGGGAIFISTPRGHNWLYELYELGQNEDFPEYWSIQAPSMSNPYLSAEELAEARSTTDPTVWRQEYEAQFVSFEGQVYSTFSRETHVINTLPDLSGWTFSVAADPGLANPTALLFIAHNATTQEDIIVDEVVRPNLLFPDVLSILQQHQPDRGYDLRVCDIAGRARGQETGASFMSWMKAHGQPFRANATGIVDGINVVRSRLLNVDGSIRLHVYGPNCPKVVESLENYHYAERTDDKNVSEEPEKDGIYDHAADALRYYIVYRYGRKVGRSWVA